MAIFYGYGCTITAADAAIAQLVERIHGKDEVSGSSPDRGSILTRNGSLLY